jgi:hypothetical protein
MIWILLVVYQIKHFIADYPLQGRYMLGKFKPYPDFILPLLSHGAVHGVLTFLIAVCLKPVHVALVLGLVDMTIHSVVDWIKANPSIGGRFAALSKNEMKNILSYVPTLGEAEVKAKFGDQLKSNTYFWWALGADQFAHHLTHYLLIWAMLP